MFPDYCLKVILGDGISGIVDLSDEPFDGVFEPLADPPFFEKATLKNGVVIWPGGLDIAPDAMYREIKREAA